MRSVRECILLAGATLVALAWPLPAHAQELSYSGSIGYATGHYLFTERTESLYLNNSLSLTQGRIQGYLSVPVIYQSTPFVSYTSAGGIPSGGPNHSDVSGMMGTGGGRRGGHDRLPLEDTVDYSSVGLGDPYLGLGFDLLSEGSVVPAITFRGQVKLPLADVDRGFGTGEWDAGVSAGVAKSVGANVILVDVAYWVLGDMQDLELKDPVSYSLSVGHTFGAGRWGLLASLSGYSRIIEGTDPPVQLGVGVNYLTSRRLFLSTLASVGLTETTSDLSISFGWRYSL